MSQLLTTVDLLLRRPLTLLERIREDGDDLRELPLHLTVIAVAGFAVFGFLLGLTHSPLWGLVAAPKLVLVGLGTAALCLPALYVYGRLLGNDGSTPAGRLRIARRARHHGPPPCSRSAPSGSSTRGSWTTRRTATST